MGHNFPSLVHRGVHEQVDDEYVDQRIHPSKHHTPQPHATDSESQASEQDRSQANNHTNKDNSEFLEKGQKPKRDEEEGEDQFILEVIKFVRNDISLTPGTLFF
ncbi:uncharacterized protein MELLADRAFT_70284 [Melampsora larici-populina 98AG31]|uniref:Uncharacterized protein n=1 Tax=Melampsora larici-populina (strain 98AG31 / pathotype 3-4-7) TaxID=747676 RepID=F4SEC4_MELLP|nr:uncharacterized protein MELLADRAFT_70284 [Melampsora larici-populina 98AG31]EGF97002.1 hypothetical protein MELLADRAFT_70284 [Melampsora larici-populina 98AG31]